jgi:hypothetical protein
MSVLSLIVRICEYGRVAVHATRFQVLVAGVLALVRSRSVSLTAMGRAMLGARLLKHAIKRCDRLLGNRHLHRERRELFRGLAAKLLKGNPRPVLVLDWTRIGEQFAALVAAVPFGGRALPIYEETHPLKHMGKRKVEARFLEQLAAIVPPGHTPILIADAGFRGPFCQAVLALGWDFVVRIRSGCVVRLQTEAASGDFHRFYDQATTRPKSLGWGEFAPRGARTEARFVLSKKKRPSKKTRPRKQRRAKKTQPGKNTRPKRRQPRKKMPLRRTPLRKKTRRDRKQSGKKARPVSRPTRKPPRCNRLRSGSQRKAKRGAIEPWFLATSLSQASAATICDLYATRMQIEETFRDTKNTRFGWSLQQAGYRSTLRIDNLFLLIALAMLAVMLLGSAAEAANRHLSYQSNTIKTRRVLSRFVLGNFIIQHQQLDWLEPAALTAALARCQAFQEQLVASFIS